MTRAGVAALALLLALGGPASAQEAGQRVLRIGTTVAPPFAMHGADGRWEGISIALLADVAARVGFGYELVEAEPGALVGDVASGRLDGAIGAIVPEAASERLVDFSNSYFQSGLAAAVRSSAPLSVVDLLKALASREFRGVLAVLVGLSAVFGVLGWLAERGRNPQFERRPATGLFTGFWWAIVTMTTVGYGDKTPVTAAGRLIGIVWMILTLGLVALATAHLSAILTAERLNGALGSVAELARMRVGAVAGGPAVAPLEALHGRTQTFATVADGLQALADGRIDAFVHDEPELAWQSGMVGGITLAPVRFGPQAYAMALPQGSALREPVNQAVLDTLDSGEWVGTLRYYLGPE